MTKVTKRKVGRPSKMTDEVVEKLVSVYKLGVTDTVACTYAGISRESLYNWLNDSKEFFDKIASAKDYVRIKAGQVVVNEIEDKNLEAAKWWLERKHSREFGKPTGVSVKTDDVEIKFVGWD